MPFAIFMIASYLAGSAIGSLGVLGSLVIVSLYGFFRAQNSNERLDKLKST